ncbi:MAG: glycosyltransferase family 2 protein, partial [Clostridia bacterium]|nr:glycosyltransferase family 2 protein [Deltaproteobacteria bacterium]
CYCEAPHLFRNVLRVLAVAEKAGWNYEVILVEDKSPDRTAEIVQRLAASQPRVKAILHDRNRGRGAAVMTGVAAAQGRIVGFFDIDLEVAPEYMLACVTEVRAGARLVVGARHYSAAKTPVRTILSRSYRGLAFAVLGIPPHVDSESGYKFFDRDSIAKLAPILEHTGWFWDTEVVYRYFAAGFDVRTVPCEFIRDPTKRSTVRIFKDSVDYARALRAFARKHGRLRRYRTSSSP